MKFDENSVTKFTKDIVKNHIKEDVHFCIMYNEDGEVSIRTYELTEDHSYLYDCELPFIHDILANYFIFNCFSKTTLVFYDGSIVFEITFDTLEELRQFYIFEC